MADEIAPATIHDYTTSRITDRQVWSDLVDAFQIVIKDNIEDPIGQIEFLRFLPPDADPDTLINTCRMLGFDLSQDILNMSVGKFMQLATQLGMYPDTNGTEDFTKFVSMMTNGTCTVDYLWTNDYVNFYLTPQGVTIDSGGNWFKTTHVNLNMGFTTLAGLQLKLGQTLGQKVVDIFYQQAPAPLVIKTQTFTITIPTDEIGFAAQVIDAERIFTIDVAA